MRQLIMSYLIWIYSLQKYLSSSSGLKGFNRVKITWIGLCYVPLHSYLSISLFMQHCSLKKIIKQMNEAVHVLNKISVNHYWLPINHFSFCVHNCLGLKKWMFCFWFHHQFATESVGRQLFLCLFFFFFFSSQSTVHESFYRTSDHFFNTDDKAVKGCCVLNVFYFISGKLH